MTDLRKAAEMALEALERCEYGVISNGRLKNSIEALRQAIAQPEQEPVDWEAVAADQAMTIAMMKVEKREWVGLTDEEILDSADAFGSFQYGDAQGHKRLEFAKVIEAKLKEKNYARHQHVQG